MPKRILIAGGTGFVGRALMQALLGSAEVRILSRCTRTIRIPPGCESLKVDIHDEQALTTALRDIDIAYYLVHSLGVPGYAARDRLLAERFARAAARAGVGRIIYLGALGDERARLSTHVRSRQETGAALRRGPVTSIELRASIIIGRGSMVFDMLQNLTKHFPVLIVPKGAERRCEPIAIHDVVQCLVAAAEHPDLTSEQPVEIAGSERISYAQLMQLHAELCGLRRHVLPMPIATPRLSGWWVERFGGVQRATARELVHGLAHDSVARNNRAFELLGHHPMSVRSALEQALADAAKPTHQYAEHRLS